MSTKKKLYLRNNHEKKILDPRITDEKIFWIHEIPMRKKIGSTKQDGTKPTIAKGQRNLAPSV